MALIIAIGIMSVLTLTTVSVVSYSNSNGRQAYRSDAAQVAFGLAEAGLNNAAAVLNTVGNPDYDDSGGNALDPTLLTASGSNAHPCPGGGTCYRASYEKGDAYWTGSLNSTTSTWTIQAWGVVRNPNGDAYADVVRTVSAQITIASSPVQPPNATAWNYMLATGKSNATTCDMDLWNSVIIDSPLYVSGNLCLRNSTKIIEPDAKAPVSVVVQGKLAVIGSQAKVGESSTQPVSEVGAKGGCVTNISNAGTTCSASTHRVYTRKLITAPPEVTPPEPSWDYWYEKANPGPKHPCNPVSATPVLDNDGVLLATGNGSAGTINLTPSTSYSCIGKDAWGRTVGQISWNNTTKTLTVAGTIYIDGNVTIENQAANLYVGSATLYLTGVFRMSGGSTRLCGKRTASGSDCDFTNWKPNEVLLIIIARGNDGSGNSVFFQNSVQFQGGFMAKEAINLGQTSINEGPMIAKTIRLEQSTRVKPLPYIDTLPPGTPGLDPNTYAQPTKPLYTGSG